MVFKPPNRIVEGKDEAMSPQQFLYKVWFPDRAPTSGEPDLTLHNGAALKFFVQAGSLLFADTPFHVCVYHLVNELMERPVAEGTYQLHREHRRISLYPMQESGILDERSGYGIITTALKEACEEQVL